jgi:hypothetical protein
MFYSGTQIIIPDRWDKVDSGIGMSYRSARLHKMQAVVRQPYAVVNYIPYSETRNMVRVLLHYFCGTSGDD